MPRLPLALAALAVLSGCTGEDRRDTPAHPPATSTAGAPAETPAETRPQALPPSRFTAEAAGLRVVLTWSPPPGGADGYAIYRDGTALTRSLPGETTTYADAGIVPDRTYTYEIESRSGGTVSTRVSVEVETVAPPLRAARLAGSFNVRTRTLERSGFGEWTQPTFGWRFRPRCERGACAVAWHDLHERRIRGRLERRGRDYRGTYTGLFTASCGSARATASVTIELRVTAARAIGGEWRATRLSGTLDQSQAAQLGCGPARARLTLRARLVD